MYPETTNENFSLIKLVIDTWYQDNMIDYTSYLEDTVWCNDRSVYKTEGSNIYYGAYGRNYPSMECPNLNDSFTVSGEAGNGMLTYPIALLTADEATLAGHGSSGYSNTSYLYTNNWFWLLSPFEFNNGVAVGCFVSSSGRLSSNSITGSNGVRPSVSLDSGTLIAEGTDGLPNNPFEVLTS